jgi:hypothetical protein
MQFQRVVGKEEVRKVGKVHLVMRRLGLLSGVVGATAKVTPLDSHLRRSAKFYYLKASIALRPLASLYRSSQ